ncbi:hypothetical protein SCHPADRAFT_912094 [Schizopora paradoxa]|uniref:Exonuclease domain-containing protein n=1 Tax=Schizopora paradoxa TaxID=27342 RepID=A0A0H2S8A2_9AGAM|nr:hypothetical protein SCHPADRAFT_912094 [Schizopora paradoxa]
MHMQRCTVGGPSNASTSSSTSSPPSSQSDRGEASSASSASVDRVPHNPHKYISIATQYVYARTERVPILARVSVVEYRGTVIFDSFVYPNEPVSDFRTHITGIQPEDLYTAPSFLEVRAGVEALVRDKVMIGHSLWEDLALLGLVHSTLRTRDVALFLPFHRTMKCFTVTPLRHLVTHLMRRKIGFGSENPIEEARASLDLFRSYEDKWESVIDSGAWPSALPPSSHQNYFS